MRNLNILSNQEYSHMFPNHGFIQQFWEKAPGQNWKKMINLMSKLGKINYIEHINGSKIYSHPSFSRIVNLSFDAANTV